MFRGDGSRAQKLENRWNCLNSFVRGCRRNLINGGYNSIIKNSISVIKGNDFQDFAWQDLIV